MDISDIDIGELIKQKLKEQDRSILWLAKKIGADKGNIYRMLRKKSLDSEVLYRISIVMKYDFCKLYSDAIEQQTGK